METLSSDEIKKHLYLALIKTFNCLKGLLEIKKYKIKFENDKISSGPFRIKDLGQQRKKLLI